MNCPPLVESTEASGTGIGTPTSSWSPEEALPLFTHPPDEWMPMTTLPAPAKKLA
jgi:hypothetical protein